MKFGPRVVCQQPKIVYHYSPLLGGGEDRLNNMVHPDTEIRLINSRIGYGVVATKLIPRGTITWARDDLDQIFPLDAVERVSPFMRPFLAKYSYINGGGRRVLCWDHARFINHSCEPTCLSPGFDFEIAVRDIEVGEELTDDYGTLNLSEEFECACGSPRCRRAVQGDDLPKYALVWDAIVASAFRLIPAVEQPLWPLVTPKADVERVLAGVDPVPSCLRHYWPYGTAEGVTHRLVEG